MVARFKIDNALNAVGVEFLNAALLALEKWAPRPMTKIERLLIRRFDSLVFVKRFVVLWVSLFALLFFCVVLQLRALVPHYQKLVPVAGGMYSEGLIGNFTNANPLYATGAADSAISH